MLFNSIDFAIFYPIVFLLYWFVFDKNRKQQNTFLLFCSLFFYAYWDIRFLILLLFSIGFNFFIGKKICTEGNQKRQYRLTTFGVLINLLLLGYFKYFDFFTESFLIFFSLFNKKINFETISMLLPIGISFYTFQTISYLVDLYKKKVQPENSLLSFSIYVSFFPQLIAGPIQRAGHLLLQINNKRNFNYAQGVDGMRLILLGLFEKIVIADNCSLIVNAIYSDAQNQTGSTLFFTAILFSFQIYGDFSGYSHIAIGCAKLLGFEITKNFNYPYLAKNIADFWRRWHISFSTWLRDYVYFPLGGNKVSALKLIVNLFIVFLITGIWHGATLNFVVYGLIHATLFVIYVFYKKAFNKIDIKVTHSFQLFTDAIAIFSTFTILTLARIFFKTASLKEAFYHLETIFSMSFFTKPIVSGKLLFGLFLFLFLEWLQRNKDHLLDISDIKNMKIRYIIYFIMIFMIFYYNVDAQSFIYFQF